MISIDTRPLCTPVLGSRKLLFYDLRVKKGFFHVLLGGNASWAYSKSKENSSHSSMCRLLLHLLLSREKHFCVQYFLEPEKLCFGIIFLASLL